jgi:fructan beta-fructosidase
MKYFFVVIYCIASIFSTAQSSTFYEEKYRPQFHFTPPIHWMNDPNGLVYNNGEYHLFYQFNPFGNRWGHMSWGHAVSKDLIHWQHLPVAIPEEKDTMIFSGSCVVDHYNSSGFAKQTGQIPMVAVYTAHIENLNQSQCLAYSLDGGRSWTKYPANPVLDLHKKDFRDPKVFWYAPGNKWIMAAAWPIEKQVHFYTSTDLKQWISLSNFGPAGDTTGIWECPDLFEVPVQDEPGKTKWVLMHSPAPYMQYFVGEFDGQSFTNVNPAAKIYRPDYGPDYYAAITYNDLPAGQQPVSIGWINNWNYANDIPTTPWKSAMSIPRKLSVRKINNEWILIQQPVDEIKKLRGKLNSWRNIRVPVLYQLPATGQVMEMELQFAPSNEGSSGIRLAVGGSQFIEIGYDGEKGQLYIDRSKAGDKEFNKAFAGLYRSAVSLVNRSGKLSLHIFFDKSIVEVFANEGEVVLTAQLFPAEKNNRIQLFNTGKPVVFESVNFWPLKSVW